MPEKLKMIFFILFLILFQVVPLFFKNTHGHSVNFKRPTTIKDLMHIDLFHLSMFSLFADRCLGVLLKNHNL